MMEMNGLIFPKQSRKKRRLRHPPSILHDKADRTCYLCMLLDQNYRRYRHLHEHHIFGGLANRPISEANGLKVYLCLSHHFEGPENVHSNAGNMELLRQEGQRAFEKTRTREEFIKLIGKNYL